MSKVEGGGRADVADVADGGGADGVADGIMYGFYGRKAVLFVEGL